MREEWLHCDLEWTEDLVPFIEQEKDCNKRLREFQNILDAINISFAEVDTYFTCIDRTSISSYVYDLFQDNNLNDLDINKDFTYYFFNICTGEALHITYKVTCSGPVTV